VRAHRFAWELTFGPIPTGDGYHGTCIRHRCDTRACVNPHHLVPGTQFDNIYDAVVRDRVPHGGGHCHAKLSDAGARRCLIDYIAGASVADIARREGVSFASALDLVAGRTWRRIRESLSNEQRQALDQKVRV
jgi:hypothetical protein